MNRHNFLDFIHPEDRERLLSNLEYETTTGRGLASEFRAVTPDGRIVQLEERGRVIRHGDQVIGLCGILRDITDRKRVEEALRESEQKFRSIRTSAGCHFMTDMHGVITYISPSSECDVWLASGCDTESSFPEFLAERDVPLALAEFEENPGDRSGTE